MNGSAKGDSHVRIIVKPAHAHGSTDELAFVDKTQSGKVWPVKVLEKERLAVQGVYGEMISTVRVSPQNSDMFRTHATLLM
jgi:hypothetical protein